jgi:hypothetical protein
MEDVKHLTTAELESGLDEIRNSPTDEGVLRLIVRRPETEMREVLEEGELALDEGLVGDNWLARGSRLSPDGTAHPDMQLNIINVRSIALISPDEGRWHLAGDQLFLDMDLSGQTLPPGSRLQLGSAIVEVTDQPHTGCHKFIARFGQDAMEFVNSPVGRELNLRGINAKVVQAGTIRLGDVAKKL